MKRKAKKTIYFLLACSLLLTGCAERTRQNNTINDETPEGIINTETSTYGVDSAAKDFESQLMDGYYYVVHNGIYYPLYSYDNNDGSSPDDYVDPDRQWYFTTENEINIPTLYEGDTLVYYSTQTLLDYVVWERLYDLGYTIGLHDIKEMTSGRQYLDLSSKDKECIVPDSELYAIYDLKSDQVLLDKISGQTITSDLVEEGLITSTQKSRTYDLEVYNGTYYQHYLATANIHAFKSYELFASVEYKTLQDCFYEIEIPEYFVNGYYLADNCGVFRLVRGTSYTEETDFNEQLLYPKVDENAWNYDPDAYVSPRIYSTFEPLNQFVSDTKGTLGFVSEGEETEEKVDKEKGALVLKEATIKEIELWFPAGKQCAIKITSPSAETTGDIYVTIDGAKKEIPYNRIDAAYEGTFTGKGQKGTLTVSGLWKSYDIELTNAEQYTNQDEVEETKEEEQETPPETTEADKSTESSAQ
jgi:hypothetical protein